jgi:hypothetical protein
MGAWEVVRLCYDEDGEPVEDQTVAVGADAQEATADAIASKLDAVPPTVDRLQYRVERAMA